MAVAYPKLHGTGDVKVKPGTLGSIENADGTAWVVTLNGKSDAFDALGIVRGAEPGISYPDWGIPAGYYIDELRRKVLLGGVNEGESCIEAELVCRTTANMGDGIVIGSEPEVFTVDWEPNEIPLQYFETRYPATAMKGFVGSTSKTLWSFIQNWINAESREVQEAVYQELMALGSTDQKNRFQDFVVMYLRGITSKQVFYPVLVRTKRTNTASAANATPGQIDNSPPSGFDAIKPTGTWTYRRMPTRIERIGRSGGYNIIDRWIGDPAWEVRLYGTESEQGGSGAGAPQTLG